jgi:hypothetical protein
VTFSSNMPSANYRVAWVFSSDTDWGGGGASWGYLYVSARTASGFTLILNDNGGNANNAPAGTTIDWIALPSN